MSTLQTVNHFGTWISYFTDKTSSKIAEHHVVMMKILQNLPPEKYSESVRSLITYLLALPQDELSEKNRIFFRRKKQQLEIRINAPYDRLLHADEKETLQIIAETYLRAVETFLFKRKDFDGKKFYEDVKNLFESEGILEKIV